MINNLNHNLIVLTGPTAVGKTELSIQLAKMLDGEIISADSIQVYKGFDIGSAKINKEEMKGVPHHLIDILEPTESFNIAMFKELVSATIKDIWSRGKLPIITGGTGFYIQSVIYDIDFSENEDDGYRAALESLLKEKGSIHLHNMLREIDPASAEAIHHNNSKRVIRALEYYHQTGEPISLHNERESSKSSPYNFAYFVLNCDRNILYERIDKRVDIMIEQGLVEEVKNLVDKYKLTSDMVSMQGLGYKEILKYLKGEITLDEAIYIIKRDTRHFAKRQLTWFRRERDVIWLDKGIYDTTARQLDFINKTLLDKNIIIPK